MSEGFMKDMRGRWKSALPHFNVSPKLLDGKHHPCPFCGGKDRFRFSDRHNDGWFYCNGCGNGSGWELASRAAGISKSDVVRKMREIFNETTIIRVADDEQRSSRKAMQTLWHSAVAPDVRSSVGLYLGKRLGKFWKSDAVREHNNTMVARISDTSGRGVNLHLTYLTKSGAKADRTPQKQVMRGTLPAGCAIALWEPREVMGIAEGIETAMSAAILFKMPVWAAVSGVTLSKWEPPAIARKIVIFGDNDHNYTGQMRAYELAHRLALHGGVEVDVRIPEKTGDDWNDVLMQA